MLEGQTCSDRRTFTSNPTRGVDLPSQQALAPRQLSDDQRYILRSLVEQAGDQRGAAIFALGYWAGCRVSVLSVVIPAPHGC